VWELVGIEFFCGEILESPGAESVVGACGNQQRDGIGLLDLEGRVSRVGGHGSAFVEDLDLPLVVATEHGNRALEGQHIPLRRDRAGAVFRLEVRNFGAHGKSERPLLIRGQPDHDHLIRVGGKILAVVSHPVLLVGNMGDGFIQVE